MIDPKSLPESVLRAIHRRSALASPLQMAQERTRKPAKAPEPCFSSHDSATGEREARMLPVQPDRFGLILTITGQVMGGKNNMGITRTGRHYPKKPWAQWRDRVVAELRRQLPKGWQAISVPVDVRLDYTAADRRRRDFPAICDAVWHCLEKAQVVTDDTLLWPVESSRRYDKAKAGMVITLYAPSPAPSG